MRVYEAIIKGLEGVGVQAAFGGAGENAAGLMLALKLSERIRPIMVRHEQAASFMACGYAMRLADAERRKAEIEIALAGGTLRDSRRGEMALDDWVEQWRPTRHDLRATTSARLKTAMQKQFMSRFGDAPLRAVTNSGVRRWVSDLLISGLSAATTRKAIFARQCLSCRDR